MNNHGLKNIDDLKPASYNPRKISKKAFEGLEVSLKKFGDISGIVWNKRTGNLVAGHQRVAKLRELGGQLLDGAVQIASGERFPVRVVDWSELQEMAANVEANNPAICGEFDDTLTAILDQVRAGVGDVEFKDLGLDGLLPKALVETNNDMTLTYSVVVDFSNQKQQAVLLKELEERGMKCRLLIS